MLVRLLLMLSGMFFSNAGGWFLCWLLVDVREFVVGFQVWLVTSVCKVEGYTKKVNDLIFLLVSIVIFSPFDICTFFFPRALIDSSILC